MFKEKSIIYIISVIGTGGAEMMLYKLIKNLDKTNLKIITIISLSKNKNELSYFNDLQFNITTFNFRNILFIPITFLKLIFYIRKKKPDIVHTWMYHADLIGGLAAKIAGVRFIIWGIRNSYLSTLYNKKFTKYVVLSCSKLSYYIPDIITSNSQSSALDHINIGYNKNKFIIIPNGFDMTKFNNKNTKLNIRDKLNLDYNTILIAHIARFHPQKNHIGFIEAAYNIHIQHPNIHYVMIGSNVDYNNPILVNKIKELNLSKHIHLLGLIENINEIISNFNFFISTSFGEAFPNVIGEAMSSNVICISTDVGDCAEIIHNYGFISKDTSSKSISDSTIEALKMNKEEQLNMKLNAKKRVETNYNINLISNLYLELYNLNL